MSRPVVKVSNLTHISQPQGRMVRAIVADCCGSSARPVRIRAVECLTVRVDPGLYPLILTCKSTVRQRMLLKKR